MSHKGHISNMLGEITFAGERSEWIFEHIVSPRPSCIDKLRLRIQLRDILPGRGRYFGDVLVKRMEAIKHVDKFEVDGRKYYTEADVLTLLAGEREAA